MAVTVIDQRGEKPVWQATFDQMTWANGESAAADSSTCGINGIVKQLVVTLNNNTNNVTATVAVKDLSGNSLYSKGAFAENATTAEYPIHDATDDHNDDLVVNGFYLTVTPSGDPGTSGLTVDIIARGI